MALYSASICYIEIFFPYFPLHTLHSPCPTSQLKPDIHMLAILVIHIGVNADHCNEFHSIYKKSIRLLLLGETVSIVQCSVRLAAQSGLVTSTTTFSFPPRWTQTSQSVLICLSFAGKITAE